ncbi:MAG: hypothetical protein M1828_003557 [Chrysothrix sp. TS-e1954]|nr:MAG: hypothetical protein M1828_003557 [Chrysothrix sp. TS-e1954]
MVLGLLGVIGAATAIPTTVGVCEGISENKKEQANLKRTNECNISVYCAQESRKQDEVHGKWLVLRNNKAYLADGNPLESKKCAKGFYFSGFYITYPADKDEKPRGMVTMISDDPPAMNWLYVDRNTLELRYGNRTTSLDHIVGPWDWTKDEEGILLEDQEAFVAVEEEEGIWAMYYDRKGHCQGLPQDKRILEISLERRPRPKPLQSDVKAQKEKSSK